MKMIVALLALSFSTAASAAGCYQIFTSSNVLVWQGIKSPIPLDRPAIDDEVKKMVPDGHLIIVDDQGGPCPAVDAIPKKPVKASQQGAKMLSDD
jgi:hypothetical protein